MNKGRGEGKKKQHKGDRKASNNVPLLVKCEDCLFYTILSSEPLPVHAFMEIVIRQKRMDTGRSEPLSSRSESSALTVQLCPSPYINKKGLYFRTTKMMMI